MSFITKNKRLRNNFLKNKTHENRLPYTKQRNYRVSLLRKSKEIHFENLDEKKSYRQQAFLGSCKIFTF